MVTLTERKNRAHTATVICLVGNTILSGLKLLAGIAGHSAAMVADALHSFSDSITDIILIIGFYFSAKPADRDHDYGHGKVETLITTFIGAVLFLVGIRILYGGGKSIVEVLGGSTLRQPGIIALAAAFVSITVKEILYQYNVRVGEAIKSQALIANAWHHRTDALSSLAALFGIGGAILLGGRWRILDPVAAVLVSVFIMKVAVKILKGGLRELLETSLSEETKHRIKDIARTVPGARNPHNLKTRRIGASIAIDLHIEVDKTLDIVHAHEIASSVENELENVFGSDTYISVHIEPDTTESS